jgi:hypothetical protein
MTPFATSRTEPNCRVGPDMPDMPSADIHNELRQVTLLGSQDPREPREINSGGPNEITTAPILDLSRYQMKSGTNLGGSQYPHRVR